MNSRGKKPLSIAVEEVGKGFVTIESEASEADAEDNGEVQE